MNTFQIKCWNSCKELLEKFSVSFEEPLRVHGKSEDYYVIKFFINENSIELFMYVNEAGIMVNENDWSIVESPDFDSDDELIDALNKNLSGLLS